MGVVGLVNKKILDTYCYVNYIVNMKINTNKLKTVNELMMGYIAVLMDLIDYSTSLIMLDCSPLTLMELHAYLGIEPKKFQEFIEYAVEENIIGIYMGKNKELIFGNPLFFGSILAKPVLYAMFNDDCNNKVFIKPKYTNKDYDKAFRGRLDFLEDKSGKHKRN